MQPLNQKPPVACRHRKFKPDNPRFLKIACLVPPLLPDLRHLCLMHAADRIIYLVDEPFSRKSAAHRLQICGPDNATAWLTLPIRAGDKKKPLEQVHAEGRSWIPDFMKRLTAAYGQATYHDFYEAELRADFENAFRAGLRPDFSGDGIAAPQPMRLLPGISYLHERVFSYLELPEELSQKPEYLSTEAFTRQLSGTPGDQPLHVWIEPRGKYYRQLGNLPEHAQIYTPEVPGVTYSRGVYPAFDKTSTLSALDLLLHHGPLSFRVLDRLLR